MTTNNTRIIGAFVLGAILLVAGAIFLFGSRDLFQKKRYFVAYFEQSVNGLNVGAPVKFRGIEVGQVKEIEGVFLPDTATVRPRLILEFYPETLRNARVNRGEYTLFQPLVDRGMRASLKSQSLLTGQLYVSLDFYDNKPPRTLSEGNDPFPEMPTFDSGLGEIFAAFEDLPLDALVGQLTSTLSSLDGVLSNAGIKESADFLPTLLKDLDATIAAIGVFIGDDLPLTSEQLRSFLITGENSVTTITGSVSTLTDTITNQSLVDLGNTLEQLEQTLTVAEARLDRNDPVSYELVNTLREVSGAATSLRKLANYLETHPEALLRGRNQ